MSKKTKRNSLCEIRRLCCYLVIAFLLLLRGSSLVSRIWTEAGLRTLAYALIADSSDLNPQTTTRAESYFERADRQDQDYAGLYRGLGFVHWYRGESDLALDEWRQSGFEADDFIAFGKRYTSPSIVLRWYELAERLDPQNQRLWLEVGLVCQSNPDANDICQRFLNYNDGNWFIDSDFSDHTGWSFNRRPEVLYRIEACPDLPNQKCATVKIDDLAPERGASWQQCLHLEPDEVYRYGAWIKVDTTPKGKWRPLYYQGIIDGQPNGRWQGDSTGSTDWQYRERVFVAEKFDDERACFHPVTLSSVGQAWFYGAFLIKK